MRAAVFPSFSTIISASRVALDRAVIPLQADFHEVCSTLQDDGGYTVPMVSKHGSMRTAILVLAMASGIALAGCVSDGYGTYGAYYPGYAGYYGSGYYGPAYYGPGYYGFYDPYDDPFFDGALFYGAGFYGGYYGGGFGRGYYGGGFRGGEGFHGGGGGGGGRGGGGGGRH
jgi:hypothetical protein